MEYTINTATGVVVRTADNVQVAPAQSTEDSSYVSYMQWIALGNSPSEVNIPVAAEAKRITKLAFRNRFTTTEKVMLEMASLDNPAATMQARQMAATLRVYLKDLDNATFIDLERSDTVAGVNTLAALGLLAAGRPAEILSPIIQPQEVPSY